MQVLKVLLTLTKFVLIYAMYPFLAVNSEFPIECGVGGFLKESTQLRMGPRAMMLSRPYSKG